MVLRSIRLSRPATAALGLVLLFLGSWAVLFAMNGRASGHGPEVAWGAAARALGVTCVMGAAFGLAVLRRARTARDRRRQGRCPHCGYDLRASGHVCPECGTPNPKPDDPLAKLLLKLGRAGWRG